jgi:hypothetical protein
MIAACGNLKKYRPNKSLDKRKMFAVYSIGCHFKLMARKFLENRIMAGKKLDRRGSARAAEPEKRESGRCENAANKEPSKTL